MKFLKLMVPLVVVATAHALTLDQATARAQQKNPAFQVLREEIAVAEGARNGAGTRANPELTIGPGIVRSTGDGATNYRFRGEVGVSQTFEFPGKRSLRLLLADGEVKLRQIALDGFREQLGIQVRRAFLQVLVTQQVSGLRAEQLRTAETFMKSAKNRVEGGYASAFESVQAQSDLIAARKEVVQVKGQLRSAKLKLAELMGSPTDTVFAVDGSLDSALAKSATADPLAFAMVKNPGLQAMALRIELAEKAVQAARLASKPDLTVSPALEYSRDEQALSVGFSVPLPIWNRGRAEVAMAIAEHRRALAEQEKLRQELSAAIHVSQEQLGNAREQLALYSPEFLGDIKNIMLRTEKVYDQSATSLLMYLEARRSYFANLSDYYETIGQLAEAQSELSAAIGVSETKTMEPNAVEKP